MNANESVVALKHLLSLIEEESAAQREYALAREHLKNVTDFYATKLGAFDEANKPGFIAEKLTKLGMANPNPALFSNHVHVYLAENLKSTGIQHLDQDEFINYIEIPKEEVLKGMGTDEFPHALMSTALCFYLKYKIKIGI